MRRRGYRNPVYSSVFTLIRDGLLRSFFAKFLDSFRHRELQFVDSFSGDGGDGEQGEFFLFAVLLELGEPVFVGDVDFGGDHQHGFFGEVGAEAVELTEDDFDVFDDVGTAAGVGDIDQVDEQARALDVAQELRARGRRLRGRLRSGRGCRRRRS